MKKWEKFSKEELEEFVKTSTSIYQIGQKCGYTSTPNMNTYTAVREMLEIYNFDTSHLAKSKNLTKKKSIKENLIEAKGHKCEVCGNSEWRGRPIPLELHRHKNDNRMELICPNCYAQLKESSISSIVTINKEELEMKRILESSNNIRQALLKMGLPPKGENYTKAKEIATKYHIAIN